MIILKHMPFKYHFYLYSNLRSKVYINNKYYLFNNSIKNFDLKKIKKKINFKLNKNILIFILDFRKDKFTSRKIMIISQLLENIRNLNLKKKNIIIKIFTKKNRLNKLENKILSEIISSYNNMFLLNIKFISKIDFKNKIDLIRLIKKEYKI